MEIFQKHNSHISAKNNKPKPNLFIVFRSSSKQSDSFTNHIQRIRSSHTKLYNHVSQNTDYIAKAWANIQENKQAIQQEKTKHMGEFRVLVTFESTTGRQNNDKDQGNDDTKDNQLYFHVLQPHLSSHLGSLRPEILCLQLSSKKVNISTSYAMMGRTRKQQLRF